MSGDARIMETLPDDFIDLWARHSVLLLGCALWPIAISMIALLAIFFIALGHPTSFWVGVVALVSLTALTMLFYSAVFSGNLRIWLFRFKQSTAPSVELKDGLVTYRWGSETVTEPLVNCRVRVGDAMKAKMGSRRCGQLASFPGWKVLLIEFPPFHHDLLGRQYCYHVAAVGFTDESFARWRRALGLGYDDEVA